MCFLLPQGVIDLEALGKKGYSVPKAGTIQVVSHPLASGSTMGRGPGGLWLLPKVDTFHYIVWQGQQPESSVQRGYVAAEKAQWRGAQGPWGAGRETK